MTKPAISICIPAYRQPQLLRRCLESIQQQQFRDFEVIVTDDSPDDAVQQVVIAFQELFPLTYQHNPIALGSPRNWNAALELATGRYIKIIHQDDWLAAPESLGLYYEEMEENPDALFAFSACHDVREDGTSVLRRPAPQQLAKLQREPECLLLGNFVGAPSTGIFRREPVIRYDEAMKWLVDIDQYIQLFYHNNTVVFIADPLVNIGVHAGQVTSAVQHDKAVVIREHLLLLAKLRRPVLKKLPYFDFCWRLLRNYDIRAAAELEELAGGKPVPAVWRMIAQQQAKVPAGLLRNGFLSKGLMLLTYLRSLFFS